MLAELIAGYRASKSITLRDLAKQIGIPHDTLWRFEKGKIIDSKSWIKIAMWALTEK